MADIIENPGASGEGAEQGANPTARTFTQEEVDNIVTKRLNRAMRGVPSEEEIAAYRTWKSNQQTEEERINSLMNERDSSKAALASALLEIDNLKHASYIASKGFTGDEAEFIAFKAAKMADEDDKMTFESAVDKLAEAKKAKPTFDWQAPVGGGNTTAGANSFMNNWIRGARK